MLTPDSATFEGALRRLNPMLGEVDVLEIVGQAIVEMKAATELHHDPKDLEAALRAISEGLVSSGKISTFPVPVMILRHGNIIVRWQ